MMFVERFYGYLARYMPCKSTSEKYRMLRIGSNAFQDRIALFEATLRCCNPLMRAVGMVALGRRMSKRSGHEDPYRNGSEVEVGIA